MTLSSRVPRKTKKALKHWPHLTPHQHRLVTRYFDWFVRYARRQFGASLVDLQSGKFLDKMP